MISIAQDLGGPGAHFMNEFSIVIQILYFLRNSNSIGFSITPLWGTILLQNIAHVITTQLSCYMQNFIVLTSLQCAHFTTI